MTDMDEVSELFLFACGICSVKFNRIVEFVYHFKVHGLTNVIENHFHVCNKLDRLSADGSVGEEWGLYQCGQCGIQLPSLCLLNDHLVNTEKLSLYALDVETKVARTLPINEVSNRNHQGKFIIDKDPNANSNDRSDSRLEENLNHSNTESSHAVEHPNINETESSHVSTCEESFPGGLLPNSEVPKDVHQSFDVVFSERTSCHPELDQSQGTLQVCTSPEMEHQQCASPNHLDHNVSGVKVDAGSDEKEVELGKNEYNTFSSQVESHCPGSLLRQSFRLKNKDDINCSESNTNLVETNDARVMFDKQTNIQQTEGWITTCNTRKFRHFNKTEGNTMFDSDSKVIDNLSHSCIVDQNNCSTATKIGKRKIEFENTNTSNCDDWMRERKFEDPKREQRRLLMIQYQRRYRQRKRLKSAAHIQGSPMHAETNRNQTGSSRGRPDAKVPCDVCGLLFKKKNLKRHTETHSSIKAHQCDICFKSFKTKNYLYSHKMHHRQQKDLICDYCGKGFNNGPNLRQHLKTHEAPRDLQCPFCPKKFRTNSVLKDHIQRHSDVKPHMCPKCGRTFRLAQEVTRHMSVHSDNRPHVCVECQKGFKCRSNLVKHRKTHAKT